MFAQILLFLLFIGSISVNNTSALPDSGPKLTVTNNGPAVLGSNVTFTARVNGYSGEKLKLMFRDDAQPKHSAEFLVSSNTSQWIVEYPKHLYKAGHYTVRVNLMKSMFGIWFLYARSSTGFELTDVPSSRPKLTVTNDSPAVLGSNVTFTARVTGYSGENLKLVFQDDAQPKHSTEFLVSSNTSQWIVEYPKHLYEAGNYTVKVHLMKTYSGFWYLYATSSTVFELKDVPSSRPKLTVTTNDSPAVLGSNVTFTARVTGYSGENLKLVFQDDAQPKHSTEFLVSSNTSQWIVEYPKHLYEAGNYTVKVHLMKTYSGFWYLYATSSTVFELTDSKKWMEIVNPDSETEKLEKKE